MAISTDFEAQKAIDDEIDMYRDRICTLLKRRNTYSAISRLPDELLAEIFTTCKTMASGHPVTLLNISAVCSYWRRISVDTPQLWSTINLKDGLSWASELLRRSKQAPLAIDCPFGGYQNDQWFKKLLFIIALEAPRLKEVSLQSSKINLNTAVSQLLGLASQLHPSLLRTLKIEVSQQYELHGASATVTHFWDELPSLKSLNLRNVALMDAVIPHMPILTHLTIFNLRSTPCPISVPSIVNFLRNTPLVETVDIGCISSPNLTVNFPSLPIHLPKLQLMSLTMECLQESRIFLYLQLPSAARLSLIYLNEANDHQLRLPSSNSGNISHLSRLISNIDVSDVAFICVEVVIGGPQGVGSYSLAISNTSNLSPILTLYVKNFPWSTRKHVNFTASLPLSKIDSLTLAGIEEREEVSAWINVMPHLNYLKNVRVTRVDILSSIGQPSNDGETRLLPNPALELITIHDDYSSIPNDWETFIEACRTRSIFGFSSVVRLLDCNISMEAVEKLSQFMSVERDK